MVELLDANVLIALAWPTHLHHTTARAWFASHGGEWATCSFTEVAFVRLSSNKKIFPTAVAPRQALTMLSALRGLPNHRFLEDKFSLVDSPFSSLLVGHRQVTDAHLLSIAHNSNARLLTLDQGIENLIPTGILSEGVLKILTA